MGKEARDGKNPVNNIEYNKANTYWMNIHYRVFAYLSMFTLFAEILMFFVLDSVNTMSSPWERYIYKYIMIPSGMNLIILLLIFLVRRSRQISINTKIFFLSLGTTAIAVIIYTIHNTFNALYMVLAIPIVMTVTYGKKNITFLAASLCIIGKTLSDVWICWDKDKLSIFYNGDTMVDFCLSLIFLLAFSVACLFLIYMEGEKNRAAVQQALKQEELRKAAYKDALTGIWNRKAMDEIFASMGSVNKGTHYTMAVMDMDNFKDINDTYGHIEGDEYLRIFGHVLRENLPQGQAFRFGGDEFCIVFQDVPMDYVRDICGQIQMIFRDRLEMAGKPLLTVSIGIAVRHNEETAEEIFRRADEALYQAKKKGKGNYVCREE